MKQPLRQMISAVMFLLGAVALTWQAGDLQASHTFAAFTVGIIAVVWLFIGVAYTVALVAPTLKQETPP